jgi:hypothetical protein
MATVVILLMGFGGGPAAATCSDNGYTTRLMTTGGNTIADVLNGKRILAMGGGEEWNEDHCANGNLFKVGVSADDPVDPRAYRGIWGVSGTGAANSMVTYNYMVGGSSSFSWQLWQNDAGGLCWGNPGGDVIATTASRPGALSGTCDSPP